jgi:hypothetical protein
VNPRESVAEVPFRTLEGEVLKLFPNQPPPRVSEELQGK